MDAVKLNTPIETNKLKITKPIQPTELTEVEIDLPYFLSINGWFIKIESPSKVIRVSVTNYEGGYNGISFFASPKRSLEDDINNGTPCTEQEFNEAFETALNKIQNL